MSENRKPDYILFDHDQIPKRYWLTKSGRSTREFICASSDPKDADEGRFTCLLLSKCQPYSDGLWAACEQYIAHRKKAEEEIKAEFEHLKKGRFDFFVGLMPAVVDSSLVDEIRFYNGWKISGRIVGLILDGHTEIPLQFEQDE